MKIDEKNRTMVILGVIFALAILYQIATNYIPSVIESTKPVEEAQQAETVKETIKNHLQTALEKYIKNEEQKEENKNNPVIGPKVFSDFVSYQENKPDKATLSLDDFAQNFTGEKPVEGLESKTLVIQIKDPKTQKDETAVYLLNKNFVSMTEL